MPKYIDIHSHINFKIFDDTKDEVIQRAFNNDTWLINVGTQYDTSKKAVELANKYKEGVYAIIGLHPIHTGASYHDKKELGDEGEEFTSRGEIFDKKIGKVVAIGECGLDYYRCTEESIEKQKVAFISQIELANELNIPLMLHIRNNDESLPTGQAGKSKNAYKDALEILKKYAKVKGVSHFFAGSLEDAKNFIDFGFYISFSGAITFPPKKNGKGCNYKSIIKEIPIEKIMADTDSPYVAPVPHRGHQNEPSYVADIVKKIAQIKGLSEEKIAEIIVSNIRQLLFN